MEVEIVNRGSKRKGVYAAGGRSKPLYMPRKVPYGVSEPNRYWSISKKLEAGPYWKKRYWRRRITGRGGYYTASPGDSFGRRWGGHIGAWAGSNLGGLAQSITGLGSYTVKKNVFMEGRLPQIVNNPDGGGIIVRFQEYLGDVITGDPDTFNIDRYLLNAANPKTFPYLSQLAANFEQFEFQGVIFQFKSTSADALNSTNTALGTVMLATQYDVLDVPFASKLNMLNYEYASSIKPSESVGHMIECAPRQTSISELYTLYNQNVPESADPRLYHLGAFNIATAGFQGTGINIGQLHVTYQVKLLKPKLYTTLGRTCGFYHYFNDQGSVNFSDTQPLGLTLDEIANIIPETNLDIELTPTTIGLPLSTAKLAYRIEIEWFGDTPVALAYPTITGTACEVSQRQFPIAGVTAGTAVMLIAVQTDGLPERPVVTLPGAMTLPTGSNRDVVVRIMAVTPTFNAV